MTDEPSLNDIIYNSKLYTSDITNALTMVNPIYYSKDAKRYTIDTKDKQIIKVDYTTFKKICTIAWKEKRPSIQYQYTKKELEDLITMLKL